MDNLNTIIKLISENLGVEKNLITPTADFFNDFNATKLEVADLVLRIQKELEIEIEEEKINQIKTVADLFKIIEENSDEF